MSVLSEKEKEEIRQALDNCKHPLFFFHDDPDGLASFLLFYRYKKEGKGYAVKAAPRIKLEFAQKVESYGADQVFVLDIAMVDQEFIDAVKVPVTWIDHHNVLEREKVRYYNPRKTIGQNIPTPYMCYEVVRQDLWLATVGCIGDWHMPDFAEEFRKQYPELLPEKITTVEEALFASPIAKIVKIFSFNLKGATSEVEKSIKTLTRIEDIRELVKEESARAKFVLKKYEKINSKYEELLARAKKAVTDDLIVIFTYEEDKLSLTKDLANELLYSHPEKIIILGRERMGEIRMSLRAAKYELPEALKKSLAGLQGYGGGHEHACGAAVKKEDFEIFVNNLRNELTKQDYGKSH
ncbi:MAG: DHH family phosphoesterase [Candidatus Aenigmarchaeota archaeon]|nr:DHH family phosphoesterase [Candidatus Aenigmarchaeota archaeon]